MTPLPIIAILGPTACGKTSLSIQIALHFNAVIINLDSVQLYKELNIGSAKPSEKELSQVKHHLVNIATIENPLSSYDIFKMSYDIIEKLQKQNTPIVLTGGTGLYYKNLLYGMFDAPKADYQLREKLRRQSPEKLYSQLQKIDPLTAKKLHPNDLLRIERALEIYYLTNTPLSEHKAHQKYNPPFQFTLLGINLPRETLYQKINTRVDNMFENGLITETQNILKNVSNYKYLQKVIGYKEVLDYLNQKISLDEAKYLVQRNSRHFAKRQLTLFSKIDNIQWFDSPDSALMIESLHSKLKHP